MHQSVQAASGNQDANGLFGNPLFASSSASNFSLQSASPALGRGAILDAAYDRGLLPASRWPTGVLIGPQDSSWNVGAFVSPSSTGTPLVLP
jgi:hypothetical protein